MNKPDIAKLVAAALEAEFGSYRNAELQHITAVNDGPHDQVPLAPLPSLPEPTEGQLAEAFKVQRYDRWRKLFNQRVTLDEAAEMLLGFSEFMAKNAKLVDAHKSNPRAPSRPVSSYLVKAFTDMRGHVEVALQKKICLPTAMANTGPVTWLNGPRKKALWPMKCWPHGRRTTNSRRGRLNRKQHQQHPMRCNLGRTRREWSATPPRANGATP